MTKIAFIGAGSTVFMKNIIGDALHNARAVGRHHRADGHRHASGSRKARWWRASWSPRWAATAKVETHTNQRAALEGADFVIVAFQIGGYKPCTVTDFEVPKQYGLRQTIADTLGVGGIMRGLRTVPHLWKIAEDMAAVCPDALMLQYVNPMAINTWALSARYPEVRQVGLCHSVQGTAAELARDLGIPVERPALQGGRHQPHGLLPELRGAAGRRHLSRPLPRPARGLPRGRASRWKATGTRAARTWCATR